VCTVLVVDDEAAMREALARGFRAEGWDVTTALDGPTGLRAALTGTFDLIVLEVILPGLSGYQLLRRLRADEVDALVLLISANVSEKDRADGFDLGADGYLVKPFSLVVARAQARALLRRRASERDPLTRRLRLGQLVIDPATRQVSWVDRPIELSDREFTLLHVLASRPDTTFSKAELLRLVWGDEQAARQNAVEVYIYYLRRKLQAAGAGHLLCTSRGRGYQLNPRTPIPTTQLPQ
jgi:DNA-binding response OmpR family regulator